MTPVRQFVVARCQFVNELSRAVSRSVRQFVSSFIEKRTDELTARDCCGHGDRLKNLLVRCNELETPNVSAVFT
jgi:hypothetical protein